MTGPDDHTVQMPTPGAPPPQDAGGTPPGAGAPPPEPTTTSRQPSLALVGGFIAIIALGVIAWLVFLSGLFTGGPESSASPSASASAGASASVAPSEKPTPSATAESTQAPTPSPSQAAGSFEVAWAPASGIEPAATVSGIEFLDGRWVAVGGVTEGHPTAAIWTSDDGATWTRATLDSVEVADEATFVSELAQVGDALVAIGWWGLVDSEQRSWVNWRSTDGGATWTELRESDDTAALSAITSGGPGLVASTGPGGSAGPSEDNIMTSADGISWEQVATFDMTDIDVLGTIGDRIVAMGTVMLDLAGGTEMRAWYSDDGGTTWTPAELPDGEPMTVSDIEPLGDGLAAIGEGSDPTTGSFSVDAWRTADGTTWERFAVADGALALALAAVDSGLVAVGNLAGQDLGPGESWTSTDAEVWLPGESLGNGEVRLAAAAGNGNVVVAGGDCQEPGCGTLIWVGR